MGAIDQTAPIESATAVHRRGKDVGDRRETAGIKGAGCDKGVEFGRDLDTVVEIVDRRRRGRKIVGQPPQLIMPTRHGRGK